MRGREEGLGLRPSSSFSPRRGSVAPMSWAKEEEEENGKSRVIHLLEKEETDSPTSWNEIVFFLMETD